MPKIYNLKPKSMSLSYPIGMMSRMGISKTVMVGPGEGVELTEAEVETLISMDRQLHLPEEARTRTAAIWTWGREGEQLASTAPVAPPGDSDQTTEIAAEEVADSGEEESEKRSRGKKKKG